MVEEDESNSQKQTLLISTQIVNAPYNIEVEKSTNFLVVQTGRDNQQVELD